MAWNTANSELNNETAIPMSAWTKSDSEDVIVGAMF